MTGEGGRGRGIFKPLLSPGTLRALASSPGSFYPRRKVVAVGGGLFRAGCTTRERDTARGKKS